MSYHDESDEPGLTLGDMLRALSGEDRDALNALMAKAIDDINAESGGLVTELRSQNASLQGALKRVMGEAEAKGRALASVSAQHEQLRQQLQERDRALALGDPERAFALAAENDRLKETVRIQREVICRHDLEKRQARAVRPAEQSGWSLFKAGLSSAFVKPIGS